MIDINSKCPVCNCSFSHTILPVCHDILHRFPGTWSVVECSQCQLAYTAPQSTKEDIDRYYPSEYASFNLGAGVRHHFIGAFLRRMLMSPYWLAYGDPEWTESPFGQSTLLEIGCGSGRLLQQMSKQGWNCIGIDISPVAVERTRKNVPEVSVFQSALADFSTQQSFDMIILSQVLEHLPDPLESLQKCFKMLSPGGKLFIGIPNFGSSEAKLFGKYWRGLDIPRHMVHFSEPLILCLLKNCGFSIVNVRPAMFASSISESLIMLLPSWIRYRFQHSRAARYLYFLTIFPAALSYLLGNRGIIEIVAQRPE